MNLARYNAPMQHPGMANMAGVANALLAAGYKAPAPVLASAQHAGFGLWLHRLQAAWYAGDHALALQVVDAAAVPDEPRVAPGERRQWHLFAALALAQSPAQAQRRQALESHCAALRRLPGAEAHGCCMLADAARARHAGQRLEALGGFDSAGTDAGRDGRHWLAALAWEQAAALAGECGLGAAMQHYRQLALDAGGRCAMPHRTDALRRAWGAHGPEAASRAADAHGTAPDTAACQEPACQEPACQEQQAEHERLLRAGSVGEIGLSIAHEVNQPLAAISLHAAAARKWLRRPEPDIERALASLVLISAAGRHAGDIVRNVQRLAMRQDTDMANVPVDQTIAETLQLLQRPIRRHGIDIELALGLGACTIQANRVQLQQVVTNLLVNAIEALSGCRAGVPGKGSARTEGPRIRIQSRHLDSGDIEISVADNGPGIAPEDRARVFGSLFSTKQNSTGMGLSISLAIVRAHGGHIAYEPGEPQGACFRLRLPVHARPGTSRAPGAC